MEEKEKKKGADHVEEIRSVLWFVIASGNGLLDLHAISCMDHEQNHRLGNCASVMHACVRTYGHAP